MPKEKIAHAKNAKHEPWIKNYLHNTAIIGKLLTDLQVKDPFQVSITSSSSRAQVCEAAFKQANRPELVPECTSKFQMAMGRCTTCCCKEGLTNLQISHALIQGKLIDCGVWFGAVDSLLRAVMSLFRSGMVIGAFGGRCFYSCALRPTKEECLSTKRLRGQAYGCVWQKGADGTEACKNRDWKAIDKQKACAAPAP